MKLIVNADDFGYSNGVNYGIIDAHRGCALCSTTLMVTMPGVLHAVGLMDENPNLAVGLHINTAFGKPITGGKTLVGKSGVFIKPDCIPEGHAYNSHEIEAEVYAQYERFVKFVGKDPSHIDSHLDTHEKITQVRDACCLLAKEKRIPLRNVDMEHSKHVTFIQHRSFDAKQGLEYFIEYFNEIQKKEFVEIMAHPAYIDNYLMKNSSYNLQRTLELEFLLSERFLTTIKQNGVVLTSYYDAKR